MNKNYDLELDKILSKYINKVVDNLENKNLKLNDIEDLVYGELVKLDDSEVIGKLVNLYDEKNNIMRRII